LVLHIESWAKEKGAPSVEGVVRDQMKYIKTELEIVREYVSNASDDLNVNIHEDLLNFSQYLLFNGVSYVEMHFLIIQMIQTFFQAFMALQLPIIILSSISAIFGGSSFILPLAPVALIGSYFLMKTEAAQAPLRSRIFESVKKDLQKEENQKKMRKAFGEATEKIFSDVSLYFEKNAQQLIDETAKQLGRREEKMRQILEKIGGDPAELQAELEKIEREARDVLRSVDELESLVARVRSSMTLSL
jgi:hypothetical protein